MAKLAVAGNLGGITVTTLREAEYFLENAIPDITYAVPIVASKLDRAAALVARGADLKLATDNPDVATAAPIPGLRVQSVHQEHGLVTADGPFPFDRLPVGSRVRCCPTTSA